VGIIKSIEKIRLEQQEKTGFYTFREKRTCRGDEKSHIHAETSGELGILWRERDAHELAGSS